MSTVISKTLTTSVNCGSKWKLTAIHYTEDSMKVVYTGYENQAALDADRPCSHQRKIILPWDGVGLSFAQANTKVKATPGNDFSTV